MNCWVFDDQYWKKLYEDMQSLYSFLFYPIKENINNPLYYIDKIKDGDLILLDNYFPVEWSWEEELGDKFLEKYLELWLKCKIICISDYWENLLDKFVNRKLVNNKWDIVYWCSSKDINDIPQNLIWNCS